jgi:hypothetical protein
MLPGTQFPMQDFVVGEGIKPSDLYKPGLRSAFNIDNNKWIVPPERDRVHDVKAEQGGFYAYALQQADKMSTLLRYEPDKAIMLWHQIHKKRQRDMRAGRGDATESNLVYKFLFKRGLIPEISEYSGEYIAKTASEPTKPPHLREGTSKKHCGNCKMYHKRNSDEGKCWGYGNWKVRDDRVCDSWSIDRKSTPDVVAQVIPLEILDADLTVHRSGRTKIAAPFDRQLAKFVYDPQTNRLLLGQMGAAEGENPTHSELLEHPMWGDWDTSRHHMAFGNIAQNGYGNVFGRNRLAPGNGEINPYQKQYQTERALQLAVPGARFTNPVERLKPEWDLPDPEITYIGEPPTIDPADKEDTRWNFQAKVDVGQVAQRIYEKAIDGAGGTINLHGEGPHTRYGFAPDLATQTPFPLETFSPADVESFIQRFGDRLRDPEKFIGSWIQGDEVILDVSEGHDSYDTAFQRAWDGHQQTMWDSQINDEIPVRGLDYEQPSVA